MTRFERLSPESALACLVMVAVLVGLGLWISKTPAPPSPTHHVAHGAGDLDLYRGIIAKVRGGARYEETAVLEHRAKHYPLRPPLVVRPPLLANFLARLPNDAVGDTILAVLGAIGMGAWAVRLLELKLHLAVKVFTAVASFSGSIIVLTGHDVSLFHEYWAGQLISLSLAVRTRNRFTASVILGLLAATIRETAMPYLVVMALVALWEKRWREGSAFAVALAAVIGALTLHVHTIQELSWPDDLASRGWVKLGGWRFVLSTACSWKMFGVAAGTWAVAILVPFSLLGALALKGPTGLRLFFLLGGYTLGFLVVGRPENFYWGLIIGPLTGVALVFAPLALWDLVRRVLVGSWRPIRAILALAKDGIVSSAFRHRSL
ncbi:MAG: hypothetical protein WBX25_18985 [Rhodomicrobium sp.]